MQSEKTSYFARRFQEGNGRGDFFWGGHIKMREDPKALLFLMKVRWLSDGKVLVSVELKMFLTNERSDYAKLLASDKRQAGLEYQEDIFYHHLK